MRGFGVRVFFFFVVDMGVGCFIYAEFYFMFLEFFDLDCFDFVGSVFGGCVRV